MKDYKEMAASVFRRRDALLAARANQKKTVSRILCQAGCFCLVALLGFGAWKSGILIRPDSDPKVPGLPLGTEDAVKPTGVTPTAPVPTEAPQLPIGAPATLFPEGTAHAVYSTVPATYAQAGAWFAHPIAECSAEGFLGYQVGAVTPDGDIHGGKAVYLSVIYSFQNGQVELTDSSRLGAGASIAYDVYPSEKVEYRGCTFWHNGTAGLVYLPLSDGLILTANLRDMELPEIYDLLRALGGKA